MSIKTVFVLLGLGLLYCKVEGGSKSVKLKIAAFNADTFGLTKVSNTGAVSTLCKIIHRYDVILMEEIRDSTETVIYSFLDTVNNCPNCTTTCIRNNRRSPTEATTHAISISERLGRTNNKEQYAFLYRTDILEVLSTHQYNDSVEDNFEREPFSILLHSLQQGIPDFFLMGIRTKPSATVQELNALIDAYDQTSSFFGTKDGLILGDFNADCSYLSRHRYNSLDLVSDTRFTWLIGNDADTTTSSSNCAYDRILVSGDISTHVIEGSAVAFPFDQEFGLSKKETNAVSNRYPVEVTLEGSDDDPTLKVAAFNIRVFGRSKFKKIKVVSILCKIVHRYDIILVQEIHDSSETVIYKFLEAVNSVGDKTYAVNVSERLGRTKSKEQYAYMYRTDKVHILSTYQYDDPEDVFEREPYSVLIQSIHPDSGIPDFFLVGVHIKPSDTVAELNALDDVYDQAASLFGTQIGVLLGDFNADCSYLSKTRYLALDLVKDTRFTWLIGNDVDTTVARSDCSYDRIIVAGNLLNYTVENSAVVFNFDVEYGLNELEAKRVSDHYPIEMTLTSS